MLLMSIFFIFAVQIQKAIGFEIEQTTTENYIFRRSWGAEGSMLSGPADVAIGTNQKIYIANGLLTRLTIVDMIERTYTNWVFEEYLPFPTPQEVVLDGHKNVYINHVLGLGGSLEKYDQNGDVLVSYQNLGHAIRSVLLDDRDNVFTTEYVADPVQSIRVVEKFSNDGILVNSWNVPIEFGGLRALDSQNHLYFIGENGVQVFTETGQFVQEWDGDGQITNAMGAEIDANQNIFISDWSNSRILKYTVDGTFITEWGTYGQGPGQFISLHGIGVSKNGGIYVADGGNDRIQIFGNSGEYLFEITTPKGFYPGGLGVSAIDSQGNLFLFTDDGLLKLDKDFNFLDLWKGIEYGSIAIGQEKRIYITDNNNNRIRVFSNNGLSLFEWNTSNPYDIAIAQNGNVYVLCENYTVRIYNLNGTFLNEWEAYGGMDYASLDLAVDQDGDVFILFNISGETNFDTYISKFTSEGALITSWGEEGQGNGQFEDPHDITIDNSNNVYVVEWGNARVQKFDNNGNYLTQFGVFGYGPGELVYPSGIAIDSNGNVYVQNHYQPIQVFSPEHPSPDPYSGLVQNGSFENSSSLTEWTYGGELPVSRSAHSIHNTYALQLGNPVPQNSQGLSQAWAYQTIYVDPAWSRPVLSFSYNMFVNHSRDYSDFFVEIQDGMGLNHFATVLRDGFRSCQGNYAPPAGFDLSWRSYSYDLSVFKGQHIRLVFSNRNLWPYSWGIWTYVDNVRILDAGALPAPVGPDSIFLPVVTNEHCDFIPTNLLSKAFELIVEPQIP